MSRIQLAFKHVHSIPVIIVKGEAGEKAIKI